MKLTLSGGGFRATLFHLGVVQYLRHSNRLQSVREIYAVSGGSILAAHLSLNWTKYTSDDDSLFEEAASEIVDFCGKDIRGHVLRAWLLGVVITLFGLVIPPSLLVANTDNAALAFAFPPAWVLLFGLAAWILRKRWSLTAMLQQQYHSLYKAATLARLNPQSHLSLHLLSTNLTTGQVASFTNNGLTLWDTAGKHDDFSHTGLPVAVAVTASSAFPPLFSPVEVTRNMLRVDQRRLPLAQQLADGGVYDNLGVWLTRYASPESTPIVVSDAGRQLDWAVRETFEMLPLRAIRATDILMERVGELELRQTMSVHSANVINLGDTVPNDSCFRAHLHNAVRKVRTDLDCFTPLEMQLLVYGGYCAARQALDKLQDVPDGVAFNSFGTPLPTTGQLWLPFQNRDQRIHVDPEKGLAHSDKARLRVWNIADWVSWLTIGVLLVLCWFAYPSIKARQSIPRVPKGLSFEIYAGADPIAQALTGKYEILARYQMVPTATIVPSSSDGDNRRETDEQESHDAFRRDELEIVAISGDFSTVTGGHRVAPFELLISSAHNSTEVHGGFVFVLTPSEKMIWGPFDLERTDGVLVAKLPGQWNNSYRVVVLMGVRPSTGIGDISLKIEGS